MIKLYDQMTEEDKTIWYAETISLFLDVPLTAVHMTEIEPECGYDALIDW